MNFHILSTLKVIVSLALTVCICKVFSTDSQDKPPEEPEVYYILLDADSDLPVKGHGKLKSGTILNLSELPSDKLNFLVKTDPKEFACDSIIFWMDGKRHTRVEKLAPYSYPGDIVGNFNPWEAVAGPHELVARIFGRRSNNQPLELMDTLKFSIISEPTAAAGKHEICFTKNPVTINGYLNEWGNFRNTLLLYIHERDTTLTSASENRVLGKGFWDEENLYFAFEVEDTNLIGFTYNNGKDQSTDDGLRLYLGFPESDKDSIAAFKVDIGLNNNVTQLKKYYKGHKTEWRKPQTSNEVLKITSFVRSYGTLNKTPQKDSIMVMELRINVGQSRIKGLRKKGLLLEAANRDNDYWRGRFMIASSSGLEELPVPSWQRYNLTDPEGLATLSAAGVLTRTRFMLLAVILVFILLPVLILIRRSYGQSVKMKKQLKNELGIKIDEFIDERFREQVVLEDFCKKYGLSLRLTQKRVKENMNTTFGDLLTKRRMAEAKKLLESSEKNVSEICFEIGFNNTSYFASVFKKIYGVAPSEVRK
jgi:AraC-like DNA-binding protein